jgi:hypothetical protein
MAQDKIVTANGDTILCRILDISAGKINYEQTLNDGRTVGKFISADQVNEYFRDSQLLPEQTVKKNPFISLPSKPFRISVEGGYGYLLSSFSDMRKGLSYIVPSSGDIDQYLSGMKNGIHLGADFYLLLNENFGVGAKYSLFASRAELNMLNPLYTDSYLYSYIPMYYAKREKESFYFNYIAPSLFFRQWLDKKRRFAFNESLSLGCVFYRDEIRGDRYSLVSNSLEKSRQFAGNFDVSVEYYLLPCLSVSANGGVFYTKIGDVEQTAVDSNGELQTRPSESSESINMSRLNFSAGLHFYF